MKKCGRCGVEKPLDEFHQWNQRDGRQLWCKSCRKEYDRKYHARTRERRFVQKQLNHDRLVRWYRDLKTGRPCSDCGGVFHHAAMTWDHLPGRSKLVEVSTLVRRNNRTLILEEIAKCELVC